MEEELRGTGWEHLPAEGLIAHLGGLWQRVADERLEIGFIARACHLNLHGVVHGGMMMTVVDRAFAMAARFYCPTGPLATISLSHQFLAPLPLGAFAFVRPRLVKSTSRMAFMEGTLMGDDGPVLQAQGIWRMKTVQA